MAEIHRSEVESPAQVVTRLRLEGRVEESQAWYREKVTEYVAGGLSEENARTTAALGMGFAFPPTDETLARWKLVEEVKEAKARARATIAAEREVKAVARKRAKSEKMGAKVRAEEARVNEAVQTAEARGTVEPTLPIVKEDAFPWDDLPAKADPKVEADWIYANYKRVVIENASGKALIHWGEALTPPPSEGTRTLLKYAVGNFHGFIKDVWMKFNLSSDDVSDEENVRREKTSISEIKRILEELREVKA